VLAVSLPDLVGDKRAQNMPGTFREYPNWCVPTCDAEGHAITIEDLSQRPDLVERTDRLIAAISQRSHG
jgi:4-alpha-glucanotransferase